MAMHLYSKFILRRTVTAIMVLLGATFLTYGMMMLAPGDAIEEIAIARYGGESMVDSRTLAWIRHKEGLDRPFLYQYLTWLRHALCLDFGISLVKEVQVKRLLWSRFLNTVRLAVSAIVVALLISVPLGIVAAVRQGTWIDSLSVTFAMLGVSVPNYWLGLMLIVIFCVKLHWLPSFGSGQWQQVILPSITLGTALTAYTTKILRSAVIDALGAEYLFSLRGKGIENRWILGKHIIKNAFIPVVTVVGIELGMILEGAVITETIFAWPGLGMLLVNAVSNRDYPLLQGVVLLIATVFVVINMVVDIICHVLNPRVNLT